MKRPLCAILLFYVAGIIFGQYLNDVVLFFIAALIAAFLFWRNRQYIIFVMPLFTLIAALLYSNQINAFSTVYDYLKETGTDNVRIYCIAEDITFSRSGNMKVSARTIKIESGGSERDYDGLNVCVYLPDGVEVKPGQAFIAEGELLPFDVARNPGAYDEFNHLRSNWLHYKIYSDKITHGKTETSITSVLVGIRLRAAKIFDTVFPAEEAGIIKSIIIGDKSGLSDDARLLYSEAGIYHILAVSGLHVAIISQILDWILKKLGIKNRNAGIITLSFLIIYCVFTGAGAATVRATIMSAAIIIGGIIGRDRDGATTVSFAALCLLLHSPMLLYDFGFLYTFASVYGFVFGGVVFDRLVFLLKLSARHHLLLDLLNGSFVNKHIASSLIAAAATYPLFAYSFYKLPIAGIFINIIIAPSVILIVIFGFLTMIAGFIMIPAAAFMAGIPYYMVKIYEFFCKTALKVPYSLILTGCPPLSHVIGAYIILALIVYYCKSDVNRRMAKGYVLKLSLALYITGVLIYHVIPKPLNITMLDVWQGDSTVVSKDGVTAVIDGGGYMLQEIGNGTGKHVVSPYLDYLGEDTVTAVFVTHADADHAYGIIELMSLKKVKTLFLPAPLEGTPRGSDEIYDLLIDTAAAHETEVSYIKAGQTVRLKNGVNMKCLYPEEDTTAKGNDMSIVMQLSYFTTDMLLTGDIGGEIEKVLVEEYGSNLQSEILKVAHHGSKFSTSMEFVEQVKPLVGLIGVGRNNPYGHPTLKTLTVLDFHDVSVFTTARNGAITITIPDGGSKEFEVRKMIE